MFLPISHDRMVVSRWPWVSLAIVGLCVVVFLATRGSQGDAESGMRFEEAARYALANPELAADHRLLTPDLAEALRAELPEELFAGEGPGTQEELDRLTGEWLASLERAPTWRWGTVPAAFRPATLVTGLFLHAGWLHLIGNLLFLYLTGPILEDRIGSPRFALLYFAGGGLAAALHVLFAPDVFRPLVGASGAIAAVMGAFAVLLGRVRVKVLVWLGVPLGTMVVPAWALFPFWFAIQVVAGLRADATLPAGAGGVAYGVHAWGFLAGLAFGFAFRGPVAPADAAGQSEPADRFEEATRLLAKRRWDEAWDVLLAEARGGRRREEAALALWELAKQTGRAAEAAPWFARRLRAEARSGDPLAAAEGWRELTGALRGRGTDPLLAIEIAEALARAGEGREAREELVEAALEALTPATSPELGARVARLATAPGSARLARARSSAAARADLPAELRARLSAPAP